MFTLHWASHGHRLQFLITWLNCVWADDIPARSYKLWLQTLAAPRQLRHFHVSKVVVRQVLKALRMTTVFSKDPGPPRNAQITVNSFCFYSHDAMHSAVFATATCLSVRLSVTAGIVSRRATVGSWNVHHPTAPWFHFLARYDSSKNSQAICRHISKMVHFRHKVTIGR